MYTTRIFEMKDQRTYAKMGVVSFTVTFQVGKSVELSATGKLTKCVSQFKLKGPAC